MKTGITGRILWGIGYYRNSMRDQNGVRLGEVKNKFGRGRVVSAWGGGVSYDAEKRLIDTLRDPQARPSAKKRILKQIAKGKITFDHIDIEEARQAIEALRPEFEGLVEKALAKLPASAPGTISESMIEPAEPAEAESDGEVLTMSKISSIEVLEEGADTQVTPPPSPVGVDEEAPTKVIPGRGRQQPEQPEVDENAPTRIRQVRAPVAGAQAQPASKPEGDKGRVYFASQVTQIIGDLTTSEINTLENMEGDSASIVGKLIKEAEVLKVRVRELETKVQTLRDENEALPEQILDALQEQFPSLANQVALLKSLYKKE